MTMPQPSTTPSLTPLQLRQWQRAAQRSVRLALTAFKAGRSKVQQATDDGTTAATQLTNSMLTARYIPAMQLPQALKGVDGTLQAAAVAKLGRRQQQHLQELQQAVQQVAAAVASMEAALEAVRLQGGEQVSSDTQPQQPQRQEENQQQDQVDGVLTRPTPVPGFQQHQQPLSAAAAASPDSAAPQAAAVGDGGGAMPPSAAAQCARMPVFHMLTLAQSAGMLQRVLTMHQQDLQLKQQVLRSFAAAIAGASQHAPEGSNSSKGGAAGSASSAGESSSSNSSRRNTAHSSSRATRGPQTASAGEEETLKRHLTVLISCWMTKPHVEDEQAAQLLQVLSDEMTGF